MSTGDWRASYELAKQEMQEGHYAEAVERLRGLAEEPGLSVPYRAHALNTLSIAYLWMGDLAAAEKHATNSLQLWGKPDPTGGSFYPLTTLGRVYTMRGEYKRAQESFEEALGVAARIEPSPEDMAGALNSLASLEYRRHRFEAAALQDRRALELLERRANAATPVATALNNLAVDLIAERKYEEASTLAVRAVAIWRSQAKREVPEYGVAMATLGSIYLHLGRPGDAEPLFEEALPVLERWPGAWNRELLSTLTKYAKALRDRNKKAEARQVEQRIRAMRQSVALADGGRQIVDVQDLKREANR